MKRTLGRFFPGIILLALVSILSPTDAYASIIAKASNSMAQSITSVTFKVAPEAISGPGLPPPTSNTTGLVTWNAVANGSDFYAFFKNTGTINVNGFSWIITQTVVGNGTYSLDYCPLGLTYNSPTQCSDLTIPTLMGTSGTGPALTVGQWRPIHISIKKSGNTFTVGSSVSRSDIRAGTNTVG